MIRGIFIGSIIYGKPAFTISVRDIDLRPRRGKGSQAKIVSYEISEGAAIEQSKTKNLRLLLDGQQRITSIVRALLGRDKIYFVVDEKADVTNVNAITLEFVFGSIETTESYDKICVSFHDAWDVENKALDEEMRELFESTQFYKRNFENWTQEQNKLFYRVYRRIINQLIDLFKQQKLVSFYLLDMGLQQFCMFFERSNSRGIQLDFTDILAAKLYNGFNLRKEIERFKERYPDRTLNKEVVIRTIGYISSTDAKKPAVIIDKDAILKNLEASHFNQYWDEVISLYDRSIRFLIESHFIISQSWIPTENILVPLMVWLRAIKDFSQATDEQSSFLTYWFWSSIFANKYSTSSNDIIVGDCRTLGQIASGTMDLRPDFFRRQRSTITEPNDFFGLVRSTNAVYKGTLNLVNFAARGLPDWNNTQKITSASKPEDHHIYPRGFLMESSQLDMDDSSVDDLADCVVNRTLMPKLTNITVGKRPPREYLLDIAKKNGKLSSCLEQHLIDPTILDDCTWDSYFQAFLDDRAEKIYELVDRYVVQAGKAYEQRFAPGPGGPIASKPRLKIDRMIKEGILVQGDEVYFQKAQNRVARVIDDNFVEFDGKSMRWLEWAKLVTNWPTINLYDRVWVSRTGQRLEDMRRP